MSKTHPAKSGEILELEIHHPHPPPPPLFIFAFLGYQEMQFLLRKRELVFSPSSLPPPLSHILLVHIHGYWKFDFPSPTLASFCLLNRCKRHRFLFSWTRLSGLDGIQKGENGVVRLDSRCCWKKKIYFRKHMYTSTVIIVTLLFIWCCCCSSSQNMTKDNEKRAEHTP